MNIFISYSGNHKGLHGKRYLELALESRVWHLSKNIPHFRNHAMSLSLILLPWEQIIAFYLHLFTKCFPVLTSGPGEGQTRSTDFRLDTSYVSPACIYLCYLQCFQSSQIKSSPAAFGHYTGKTHTKKSNLPWCLLSLVDRWDNSF